jgi:hypothetical protein
MKLYINTVNMGHSTPQLQRKLSYFIILFSLMPDYFTRQGNSAAIQQVIQTIRQCILLTLLKMCPVAPHFCYFTLSNTKRFTR